MRQREKCDKVFFFCLIPAIAKTLSLTENFSFAPASGPIEARQILKIQVGTRLNRKNPGPIDNSTLLAYRMFHSDNSNEH